MPGVHIPQVEKHCFRNHSYSSAAPKHDWADSGLFLYRGTLHCWKYLICLVHYAFYLRERVSLEQCHCI